MTPLLTNLQTYWTPIAPFLSLRDEVEYDAAVERLNALVDEVGTNERHPLYSLLDTLGTLIHNYEQQQLAVPGASGPEVLQSLMAEHGIAPGELPEFGPPADVEAYLADRLVPSVAQVRALAERFHVSPAAFL